jgi:DNA polymerase-3 subunit beta
MKILCDRQQLQEAFGVVAAIAPLKSTKPIVQNILLRAEADSVTLFATDFEMSARVRLPSVKVEQPGAVLLPARETGSLLRELSDPTVSLTSKEMRCTLESGGGSFILVGDDPTQFPEHRPLPSTTPIVLPAGELATMVRRTSFAAAKEETRYAINGVMLDVRKGSLHMVATDGRRLALTYSSLEGNPKDQNVVVPSRALQALCRAIPDGSREPIRVVFGDAQAGFEMGETLLVTRLLDTRFPDYEGVIPKAADTTIEMSASLLASCLRRVSVLCSGDVRMVRFQFGSSSLELSAEGQTGRADVSMDCDVRGAGGSISFNPDFLLDALKVAEMEQIRMDMTDESTPARFTLGEAFTYVLMPISGS